MDAAGILQKTGELLGGFVFFFQAEDGIRDLTVTGVQTCALPISSITVVPSASAAAIITLSVPRTVGPNLPRKLITAPVNFGANTLMLPPSTRTAAQIGRASCRERV